LTEKMNDNYVLFCLKIVFGQTLNGP